jgi:sugar lactone lactonase YvrE
MSLDVAIERAALLGEGPRWDARTRRLLWVDIHGQELHVFDPATGTDRRIALDSMPGAAAPMDDGRVLVGLADRLVALDLADESTETLAAVPHAPDMRLNDGACDPAGRFWIGSTELEHAPDRGVLYRFAGGELAPMVAPVTISNGIGWSLDATRMYYIDSLRYAIDVFDFDLAEGSIADRRKWVVVERGQGIPDGLAVDEEGGVWVAFWGKAVVRRYDVDGRIDRVVDVPAKYVTACAFGGDDGRSLFITSAAPDGRVFVHDPGIAGPPAHVFQGLSTAPSDAEPTSAR